MKNQGEMTYSRGASWGDNQDNACKPGKKGGQQPKATTRPLLCHLPPPQPPGLPTFGLHTPSFQPPRSQSGGPGPCRDGAVKIGQAPAQPRKSLERQKCQQSQATGPSHSPSSSASWGHRSYCGHLTASARAPVTSPSLRNVAKSS